MKKIFTLLLFAALLCGLCITGFAEEKEETDYLATIPLAAYHGYTSFTEIPQELLHDYRYGITAMLFDELFRLNIIPENYKVLQHYPSEEELASSLKIPVSELKNIIDRLYGKGAGDRAIIGQEFHHMKPELDLFPLEKEDAYAFCPAIYQGTSGLLYYSKQLDSEVVGEDLIIRSVYAEWEYGETGSDQKIPVIVYSVENSFSERNYNTLATWEEKTGTKPPFYTKVESRIRGGEFDEYLPVYKHTFKPNGDGTYYWAQTELETAGKEIPLSVIDPSAKEENTDTSTATDVSTGTVTDAVTDVSTGSATDVVQQEESSSAVWIVVAVVAVAAVAAVAVFFVLKKKKA
ncbi:MAG: hypothetical protein J6C26_00485 [Clostridia bacterium]|nr:hypothetical protein [Clostridia bacterium]